MWMTQCEMSLSVNEVTAVACKSLSLTQALEDECLKLSLSQSSIDDEDDQELLRLSRYRRKSGPLVFSQTADRQHAKSAGAGTQDKHKTVLIAGWWTLSFTNPVSWILCGRYENHWFSSHTYQCVYDYFFLFYWIACLKNLYLNFNCLLWTAKYI